jgi:hypothetical protein
LLLIGGLSLGAGLMYMLAPERGERRRALARAQVEAYRRRTNALPGHTRRMVDRTTGILGRQMRGLLTQTRPPLGHARGVSNAGWGGQGRQGSQRSS